MARDTGRPFLEILYQPYALTLYVIWQLQQLDRHHEFVVESRQFHLTSLISFATHDPKGLDTQRQDFLLRHSRKPTSEDRNASLERTRELIAAHRRMVPTDPH